MIQSGDPSRQLLWVISSVDDRSGLMIGWGRWSRHASRCVRGFSGHKPRWETFGAQCRTPRMEGVDSCDYGSSRASEGPRAAGRGSRPSVQSREPLSSSDARRPRGVGAKVAPPEIRVPVGSGVPAGLAKPICQVPEPICAVRPEMPDSSRRTPADQCVAGSGLAVGHPASRACPPCLGWVPRRGRLRSARRANAAHPIAGRGADLFRSTTRPTLNDVNVMLLQQHQIHIVESAWQQGCGSRSGVGVRRSRGARREAPEVLGVDRRSRGTRASPSDGRGAMDG